MIEKECGEFLVPEGEFFEDGGDDNGVGLGEDGEFFENFGALVGGKFFEFYEVAEVVEVGFEGEALLAKVVAGVAGCHGDEGHGVGEVVGGGPMEEQGFGADPALGWDGADGGF